MNKAAKSFNFFSYLRNYKFLTFLVPILKGMEAIIEVFIPLIMANIIDIGIKNLDNAYIWKNAVLILVLNIVLVISAIIAQKFNSIVVEGMAKDIRYDIFKHINTLSHAQLDSLNTTSLLNRSIHDVNHIKIGTASLLRTTIRVPFLLIGSLIMAIRINLKLSLIFVVVCPVLIGVVMLIMKKLSPIIEQSKVKLDKTSDITRENLTGVRVVRAFNKQNYEAQRFQNSNVDLVNTQLKLGNLSAILVPIIYTIVNFAIVAILYFGGIEVNIGGISQGNLIAFINYFNQIASALVIIARLITLYTRMISSSKRICEVFDLKNTIVDPDKPVDIDLSNSELSRVEFRDVSFGYNNIKNVVTNLSFVAEAGSTIGIIGGTGSGKSSLVNLIPRFYDCTKGSILVGNKNVKKYRVAELRQLIGIVPQNPTLFAGTIASNMRWRKPDASEDEIVKALKISQSFDFVKEYPEFINKKVNRGGTNFSGGQKQRLTIARALVGNPKILILDDSASALDFSTDAKLRKAIKSMQGVTTFIVTQRSNSIKDADKIIVLDSGNVVGIGTHKELFETCDVYREIHNSQSKGGN